MFFEFSRQCHTESSRNFFKKQILNPRHAKFDQNSDFGHVLFGFLPDLGGRPQSEIGQIRAAVPNLSSTGFGRPSQIRVRPDSDGRPQSEFDRIRTDGRVRPDSGIHRPPVPVSRWLHRWLHIGIDRSEFVGIVFGISFGSNLDFILH